MEMEARTDHGQHSSESQFSESSSSRAHSSVGAAEEAPHSRLFIVCGKTLTADELRTVFQKHGEIEDVFLVKDRATGESKGTAYVKFVKTSQAALAQEALHGTVVGSEPRPLRVLISDPKGKSLNYDVNDDNSRNRLFVVLPSGAGEKELKEAFCHFEGYDTSFVVRESQANTLKGFGYVQFTKASFAALAMENCDNSFRALVAEPKGARTRESSSSSHRHSGSRGEYDSSVFSSSSDRWGSDRWGSERQSSEAWHDNGERVDGPSRLFVIVDTTVTDSQFASLCDLTPGMEHCIIKKSHETGESRGFAFVSYDSHRSARFAKERLNKVEYPPGTRLVVKYAEDRHRDGQRDGQRDAWHGEEHAPRSSGSSDYPPARAPMPPPARSSYYDAESVQSSPSARGPYEHGQERPQYKSSDPYYPYSAPPSRGAYQGESRDRYQPPSEPAPLKRPYPEPSATQPLPEGSSVSGKRLFFVFSPRVPPKNVVMDMFSRYGNLVDLYRVQDHNYGYAEFSNERPALDALHDLHGRTVDGNYLKVMVAEPRRSREGEPSAKRLHAWGKYMLMLLVYSVPAGRR